MFNLDRWRLSPNVAPVLVAAEIGINHSGDFDLARRLIDSARESGADAVKFQVFRTDLFYNRQLASGAYDLFRNFELSFEQYAKLKEHADSQDILFFATPLDMESLAFLSGLNVPILKIASSDITSEPFLAEIARLSREKGQHVVLSTGFVGLKEVRRAVAILRGTPLTLLYCVSRYPASAADGDFDLRFIDTLAREFRVPVGFSDHSLDIFMSLGAVARGARMIERHFTLSRSLPGADHAISLEPAKFAELVRGVRELETALGDGTKRVTAFETGIAPNAMRAVYARRALKKGDRIAEKDLILLRPGRGVSLGEWRRLVGAKAGRDIGEYEKI
jgi:sialic acid synthase SpsE